MVQEFIRTMHKKTVQHRLWLVVVLGGLATLAIFFQSFLSFIQVGRAETSLPEAQTSTLQEDPFKDVVLEARAVHVADLVTGKVLYAKNEQEKLPLASVTKIMTALIARERMNSSAVVTITKEDLSIEGDTGLHVGERWRMEDLLDVMLLISSNDAAHAVSGFVGGAGQRTETSHAQFVVMMNEKAQALGLSTMEFFNESGLDLEENGTTVKAGGYGSAHNIAMLMIELWNKYPATLEITTRKDARITSQDGIVHVLPNTNEALGRYPGMIGSKTGYTELAGGNLVILFDVGIGHPVVAVVLGSSRDGRFADMQMLTQATLKAFE